VNPARPARVREADLHTLVAGRHGREQRDDPHPDEDRGRRGNAANGWR
jgi:hypothetical protein